MGVGLGGPCIQHFGTLSILYYNARSILSKMGNLAASVLVHEPDIVYVVESCKDGDVGQYEIVLPNSVSVMPSRYSS